MKRCFKCQRDLPLAQFYPHPQMADGTLNKCKDCAKADVKANYIAKRTQYAIYDRERFQQPERKQAALRYQESHRALHADKYTARTAVGNAIRDGRLVREPCGRCGATPAQAHHHDYSKPLEVEWLCFKCHRAEHGQVANGHQRDLYAVRQ